MKNEKGVTLVALIFTVILMMMLASVSIMMLTNEDESALKAANDLANVTDDILDQHDKQISSIVNEIKSTNII